MAVFTVEAIIKIISFGPRGYYAKGWNIFDFIIVSISYATLIIQFSGSSQFGPRQTTVARSLRIARIFRLIAKAKFLRIIFNTIIITFPGLANVGALMLLLLFIFSILGVQLFATVQLQSSLDVHGNFQSFGVALLTMLRCQTGEGWPDIMSDLARGRQINFDCDPNPTYDSIQANGGVTNGCGTGISYIYFILFHFIVAIIFLNLFIAVILNGFTSSSEEEGFEIFKTIIQQFKKIWQRFDPDATGFISVDDMREFIVSLESDTELITTNLKGNPKFVSHFIATLQVPTYNKFRQYYFQDVLILLSKKYIAHKYVLECLNDMAIQDDIEYVTAEKALRENQFEEIIKDIQVKSVEDKIQLIQENQRHSVKYQRRMFGKVDRFEDKVYDSSYIVWVPYIQYRLKPWLKKFHDRKNQERVEQIHLEEELNNLATNRGRGLIIETGGQIAMRGYLQVNRRPQTQSPYNESINNNLSNQSVSLNDDNVSNMTKNIRGQTTGEVGGTLYIGREDNSQLGTMQRS